MHAETVNDGDQPDARGCPPRDDSAHHGFVLQQREEMGPPPSARGLRGGVGPLAAPRGGWGPQGCAPRGGWGPPGCAPRGWGPPGWRARARPPPATVPFRCLSPAPPAELVPARPARGAAPGLALARVCVRGDRSGPGPAARPLDKAKPVTERDDLIKIKTCLRTVTGQNRFSAAFLQKSPSERVS